MMGRPVPVPTQPTPEVLANGEAVVPSPSMKDYEFHPAANLFPLMEEDSEDFKLLVEDIRDHGLLDPIAILDGKILDGRNRYRAALEAGLRLPTTKFRGVSPEAYTDPYAYVISKNLRRRHLTKDQRAEVVRKLREQGRSIRDIAEVMSVGVGTVHRALEAGVPIGTPQPDRLSDEEAQQLKEMESVIDQAAPRVTGRDGKSYAASKPKAEPVERTQEEQDRATVGYARSHLRIADDHLAELAEHADDLKAAMARSSTDDLIEPLIGEIAGSLAMLVGVLGIKLFDENGDVAPESRPEASSEVIVFDDNEDIEPGPTRPPGPVDGLANTVSKRRSRPQLAKARSQFDDLASLQTDANKAEFDAIATALDDAENAIDEIDNAFESSEKTMYREEADNYWDELGSAVEDLANWFEENEEDS